MQHGYTRTAETTPLGLTPSVLMILFSLKGQYKYNSKSFHQYMVLNVD